MEISSGENTKQELWLIGFSINPDTEYPDMYTLFFSDDIDQPILSENYIIFFSQIELAKKALEQCDNNEQYLNELPQEVQLVCNVAGTLYLVSHEATDSSATIINFLNILFDLIKAIDLSMPAQYQRILYTFADHLTFSREIKEFCDQQNISRSAIIDAILWCIGAVVSKSKLITPSTQ